MQVGRDWTEFAKRIVPGPHYLSDGYNFLGMMQKHVECYAEGIVAFKRRIREVSRMGKDPLAEEARMVCDDTRMTVWRPVDFETKNDAEFWFMDQEYLPHPGFIYSTGRVYTVYHKFVKRSKKDQRWWLIHETGLDY